MYARKCRRVRTHCRWYVSWLQSWRTQRDTFSQNLYLNFYYIPQFSKSHYFISLLRLSSLYHCIKTFTLILAPVHTTFTLLYIPYEFGNFREKRTRALRTLVSTDLVSCLNFHWLTQAPMKTDTNMKRRALNEQSRGGYYWRTFVGLETHPSGTWHVPNRITGRDGKFPVFPEQLTHRGNTCSHRYWVYIPTRLVPSFLWEEQWGIAAPTTHPEHKLRNCRASPDFVAHYLARRVSVYIAPGSFGLLHPTATSFATGNGVNLCDNVRAPSTMRRYPIFQSAACEK